MNREELGEEFDETVNSFNAWLVQNKNPTIIYRIANIFNYQHPIYGREDLLPEQKYAIALASDWKRVENDLEEILKKDKSNLEAIEGKKMIKEMYDNYKNVYVNSKLR